MLSFTPFLLSAAFLLGTTNACAFHDSSLLDVDFDAIAAQNNAARTRLMPRQASKKIALDNVRIFNGHEILKPSTVIIDGGFIGDDATGAEHIDGQGGVLLPGLIDAHCHPSNVTHLQELSRFGVTTGFVMASYSPQMSASLKNHTGLTDVLLGTAPAAAPGSTHGNITMQVDKTGSLLVHNVSQAKPWVDAQLAFHPDYVKIVAESPGLDQETLNALTREAQQNGKHVVCHASAYAAIEQAINAGVNHIHHTPYDTAIDAYMAARMLCQGQISTPTLSIVKAIASNTPGANYSAATASVRMMRDVHVPILAGTDANLQPGLIATVPFGISMHEELELLVQAGLSNLHALRAATELPAKYFGLTDRGAISAGLRADLLLVDGNPLEDIRATQNIRRVWVGGVEYTGNLGFYNGAVV